MQREILFKAKRKDNGEWVIGYLVVDNKNLYFNAKEDVYYIASNTDMYVEVIPETICQYTGLDDKNGVEIFENDLVKVKNYHYYKDKEYLIGKVVFKDGMFKIHCEDGVNASIFMFQVWSESIEVIGNIFDKEVE